MIFIGLGNPGAAYKNTRHNVGWLFLDFLYENSKVISPWTEKANYEYATIKRKGQEIKLFKPQTFMNLSGEAVKKILNSNPKEDYVVFYDDISIAFGDIKYKEIGGHGNHNGIRSIIECMDTKNFKRIKIGIDNDCNQMLKDFVLGDFSKDEVQQFDSIFTETIKKVEMQTRGIHGKRK